MSVPTPEQINWTSAKREALEKIKELPTFSDEEILLQYEQLLEALQEDEIKAMPKKLKTFVLHERFTKFAMAYGALFNMACVRDEPLPKDKIAQILKIARQKQSGELGEDKARGVICDLAETDLRSKGLRSSGSSGC